MSVLDTLITDRTYDDVLHVQELKAKIINQEATADEIAEWLLCACKGAYNYTDLNRVNQAMAYVSQALIDEIGILSAYLASHGVAPSPEFALPYTADEVAVNAVTNRDISSFPTEAEMDSFLSDLTAVKDALELPPDTPEIPSQIANLSFTGANAIEAMLLAVNEALIAKDAEIKELVDHTALGFFYSDEVQCGEV
jgi:hypothetical protein